MLHFRQILTCATLQDSICNCRPVLTVRRYSNRTFRRTRRRSTAMLWNCPPSVRSSRSMKAADTIPSSRG